jgi:mono/diheme cytochrome c family protein
VSRPEPRWPPRRIVLVPLVLFAGVSAAVFTLAELHPAKPGTPAAGPVKLGDAARGETIFSQNCASCHGAGGRGGNIGPKLVGSSLSLARAKAEIDNGGGAMPGNLVSGRDEDDVLAYLATILRAPKAVG